jgi:hypothetical protein
MLDILILAFIFAFGGANGLCLVGLLTMPYRQMTFNIHLPASLFIFAH